MVHGGVGGGGRHAGAIQVERMVQLTLVVAVEVEILQVAGGSGGSGIVVIRYKFQ